MAKTRREFSAEFKREGVELLAGNGQPQMHIAAKLRIQPSKSRQWPTTLNEASSRLATGCIGRDVTCQPDCTPSDQAAEIAAVEAAVPGLAAARSLVDRFGIMIRTKTATELDIWIEQARTSMVAPLARGVAKDKAALRAAITEPWSNGQTEGQINWLKLIKRQMYGRAKLDLLEARLIGAA